MTGRAANNGAITRAAGRQAAQIGFACAVAMLVCHPHPLHATPAAEVTVSVEIPPIAKVEFPEGADFELRLPERSRRGSRHRSAIPRQIRGGRIPFILHGNAAVTVRAEPGELVRVPRDAGTARRGEPSSAPEGVTLSYRVQLELPAGPGSGRPDLRGKNPTWGETATVDVSRGPLYGLLHVIVESPSVAFASDLVTGSGMYRGAVSLTVAPQDD